MGRFIGVTYELHFIEIESKREILKRTVNYIIDNLNDLIWQDSISNQLCKGGCDHRNKIIFVVLRLFHLKEIEEGKLKSIARYKKADDKLVIDQMLILSDYVDLPENEMRKKLCDNISLYLKEIILKYHNRFRDFDSVAFIPLLEERFLEIKNGELMNTGILDG